MKNSMLRVFAIMALLVITTTTFSCVRPEPNYEGVLMENWGRNGLSDFKPVQGSQFVLSPGTELYEVPMWEQKGDPNVIEIYTKDATQFYIDPVYLYRAIRGKSPNIVLEYMNYHKNQRPEEFFEGVEENVLNKRVTDAYRDVARTYKTDSLMNNMSQYEETVMKRLLSDFNIKYFELTSLTSGLKPSKQMIEAIEKRNVSIQEANAVRNQLETSKLLLEKSRIDAERNRVISKGLTNELLQQEYIEMLKTTSNKVIITDGKTPVMLQR